MNIEKIKDKVSLFKGKKVLFKYNSSRNQNEEFFGEIINLFPSVFIVKVIDNERIKSFSYSDILIRKLIIKS